MNKAINCHIRIVEPETG